MSYIDQGEPRYAKTLSTEKVWFASTVESELSVPIGFVGVFQGISHVTDLIRLPRW